ncbi:MAG: CHAT domain-containing protein [Acidobacteria bacterium]|nr:CHAT domain-containing protein [Acidobacteriota bacterium]
MSKSKFKDLKSRLFSIGKPGLEVNVPRSGSGSGIKVLSGACAVILILGAAFGIWRVFFHQSLLDKGIIVMNETFREYRPYEARISGFSYSPFILARGAGDREVNYLARDRAELYLLQAVTENPSPESYHALGRLYLAKKDIDKAIAQFVKALEEDSSNAQLQNDMGVALLERGKIELPEQEAGKALEDFARSLEHIDTSLKLNASFPEGLFNRALVLQQLTLDHPAGEVWQKYIEKDHDSRWAEEARKNIKSLDDKIKKVNSNPVQILQDFLAAFKERDQDKAFKIISLNHTSTGNIVINGLQDEFLSLKQNGRNSEAKIQLSALNYAAMLEMQKGENRYTQHLYKFYSSAAPDQIQPLVEARSLLKKGDEQFNRANHNEAINYYNDAKQIFERLGNRPEAIFTDFRMGHSYIRHSDYINATLIFEKILKLQPAKDYIWILARCFDNLANIKLDTNEYSYGSKYSERSLELSESIDDINGMIRVMLQLSSTYKLLNDSRTSLNYLYTAMKYVKENPVQPIQAWSVNAHAAFTFNSLELNTSVIEYQKEALRILKDFEVPNPVLESRSHGYLGAKLGQLRFFDEAIAHLKQAVRIGESHSNKQTGSNILAYSMLVLGDIYRHSGNYSEAIKCYETSFDIHKKLGAQIYLYLARKGELLCHIAQGNDQNAKNTLKEVISIFEKNRSRITLESQRNTYFDTEQSVYDIAIDFAFSRLKDGRLAYDYSEDSRARSLQDAISKAPKVILSRLGPDLYLTGSYNPVKLSDIRKKIPNQAQILQYAVLKDRLIIWVVSRDNFRMMKVDVSSDDLKRKTFEYLKLISQPADSDLNEIQEKAKELYNWLIAPAEPFLDIEKQTCIVADKILLHLPFGALVSPNGRYLIQAHRLIYAQSSNMFITSSEIAESKMIKHRENMLSVGNPAFDKKVFLYLKDLPSAAKEAKEVAALYPSSHNLNHEQASKELIRQYMECSNVIHLAMHYDVDPYSPMQSKLILTKSSDFEGSILQAYEIYLMKLTHARLVVLSACQTGIEQNYGGEGPVSAARPFIASKVPLVVASLWPVESDATSILMVGFHKYRTRNKYATVDALRQANIDLIIKSGSLYSHPFYWASFVVLGGYAEY